MSLHDTLHALETSLVSASTRASREALEHLLAHDFFEFTSSGREVSREEIIRALVSEQPSDWQVTDFRARPLSPSLALVTFRTTRTSRATRETTHALRSSLWRLENGNWKLLFHQGTRAAD